jgi:uncharacterized protein (UPF0262 family)
LARLDVPVFPLAAVVHLDLRLPFPGVADSLRDAVSLLDADHDAVRRACPDMVDAIPEGRRGRLDCLVWGVGKLAVREPRLEDAVPLRLDSAWAVFPERLALVGLVVRWAQRRAVAEPSTPDEARSAA